MTRPTSTIRDIDDLLAIWGEREAAHKAAHDAAEARFVEELYAERYGE